MSQPSFTQISAGRGGAGVGPSAGLTSPLHVCLLHVAPQRGTPELEGPPSPLPINRQQEHRLCPAPPRVLGWAANARWAGTTEGRGKGNTRCRGDRGAELIM